MLVKVKDIFTDEELNRAVHLFCTVPDGSFARRCETEIVIPVLQRINKTTGQENSSLYLAYVLQAALTMGVHK